MKKVFLATCLLLSAAAAPAQQAIWGVPTLISPEVNPDNTVTFRLNAPAARNVEVTGDFLPTQKITTPFGEFDAPGTAQLVRNDAGLWEYTTSALAPELYSYTFIVDSLKINDPSNVYMIRDVGSVTNIFMIPGDRASLYAVHDVPHGTVSRQWYDSPTLGMKRRLSVYTPAGYESGDRRYPVFYLLHGMGGDEEAWLALGRAAQILDNMIAAGKAEPMIVVMTNGNASQEAAPGETQYGLLPPTTQLPKTKDGSFEQAFPDVVSFIDANYRTIADKSHRAIAGLSMGGFHTRHISKEYPDMFDYVGLFSAAIRMGEDPVDSPVYQNVDEKLKIQFEKQPKLYWIAIGDTDFLYDNNREYRRYLDEHGYPYTYYETPEGHIWKNWRIYLTEFLPQLFK